MKKILFNLLPAILLTVSATSAYAECINWGKLMTKYEADNMPSGRKTILLQPFSDFTKLSGDDWLSVGIPQLLADYLSSGRDIVVLYGPVVTYNPSIAANPTYVIGGMYQHMPGQLRMFVKLLESGELKKQWQLDIAYPQNKQFFDTLGDTAVSILNTISPRYDKGKFEEIHDATPIVPAYENYVRGLIAYWLFNPDKTDVTKTWFEESKKADINYQNAYKGLMDLYTFLAMYNKQNKKPFGSFLQQAEKEMYAMERFSKRLPPPERPKKRVTKPEKVSVKLTNRFLVGNSSFVAGLNAAGQKQWLEAAKFFEEAVKNVPEDAITWYHLSQMRERTGDKQKAAEARANAFELNRCLQ